MPPRPKAAEDEYPIPEGREDESASWKAAFQHAMSMKWTSVKGAILYADAHQDEERHGGPGLA